MPAWAGIRERRGNRWPFVNTWCLFCVHPRDTHWWYVKMDLGTEEKWGIGREVPSEEYFLNTVPSAADRPGSLRKELT